MQYAQCVKNISYNIAQNISCILYNTYNIICTILYTLFFVYCTNCTYCTYCTYCAKGRILYVLYTIVQYIVRYFVPVLRTKLYIIVRYYVQNCTLSGPRWRGARLLPWRLAGLIPLLVLLRPIPAAAPRLFSCNALPIQITRARFTFQKRASCAQQLRPTAPRRRRQRLEAARR